MGTPLDTIKAAIIGNPPQLNKKPSRQGVVNAFAELQTLLDGETAARQATDSELDAKIVDETQRATAAELALDNRITSTEALVASGVRFISERIRVRATGNVDISTGLENGDILNGVTLATGDNVFLPNQTTPSQNGIYTVPASGAALRATFADSAAELARIGFVIQEGTAGAGERWTLSLAAADITVGTTALLFSPHGIEPGYAAEVQAARDGKATLGNRLDIIEADALTGKDGLYSALTQSIIDRRGWNLNPVRSFPASPDLPFPSWLTFSRSSVASFVDADGLVKIAAIDAPRHEFDPETGEYLGLLLECEPKTNMFLRSEEFDNASWTKTQSTVTANAGVAPDGTMSADKLAENTAVASHFIQQSVALTASAKNSWSPWFKDAGDGRKVRLRVFSNPTTSITVGVTFDPATGEFSNPSSAGGATQSYSAKRHRNGWWRVSHSFTLGGSNTAVLFRCELTNASGVSSYTGDGVSGVLIWGWQAEAGEFPSSYIKTEGSTVTRQPDVLTASGLGDLFGANGGALLFNGLRRFKPTDIQTLAQIDNGTSNDYVLLRTTAANVPGMIVTDGAVTQASIFGSSEAVISADQEFSILGTWAADDFAVSINGGDILTDVGGSMPSLTTLRIGNRLSAGSGFFGYLRQIALFAQRITDASAKKVANPSGGLNSFAEQTWVFFGDSLTEFSSYPARIAARLGINAINVGFGGTRMTATVGTELDDLSMVRLAQAVASGDWTAQNAAVAAIVSSTYSTILDRLMAIDWTDVDGICIFHGTNDYGGNVALGTISDAVETTYRGAINVALNAIMAAHKHLKVVLIAPLWRQRFATGDGLEADANPNGNGDFLIEFVDAEIEQAQRNKVPVLDMYRLSGINIYNHATYLDDGLHIRTEAGNQRVADKIASFVGSNF